MKITRKGNTKEYILEADRNSDNPTKFHYKQLTWKQMNKLNRMQVMDVETALEVTQIHKTVTAEKREYTPEENTRLNELLTVDAEFLSMLSEMKARACEFGLVKIEDMLDEDGKPYDISIEDFVELSDPGVLRELGDVIILGSQIPGGQAAAKN